MVSRPPPGHRTRPLADARLDAARRPTLVLLAGSPGDAGLWRHQVDALSGLARIEVLTPVRHGKIGDHAAAVLAQVTAPRFALAGFSLGGAAALEIMRRAPERVDRLALLSTSARADPPSVRARRAGRIAQAAEAGTDPVEDFIRLAPGPAGGESVLGQLHRMISTRLATDRMARQDTIVLRPDSRPLLGTIRCPTLVLCGGEDRTTPPAFGREIAAAIPGAEFAELAGVGHMVTLEAPAAVNAAMARWLAAEARAWWPARPAHRSTAIAAGTVREGVRRSR